MEISFNIIYSLSAIQYAMFQSSEINLTLFYSVPTLTSALCLQIGIYFKRKRWNLLVSLVLNYTRTTDDKKEAVIQLLFSNRFQYININFICMRVNVSVL